MDVVGLTSVSPFFPWNVVELIWTIKQIWSGRSECVEPSRVFHSRSHLDLYFLPISLHVPFMHE